MKPKVLIVDYGVGNLLSVSRAFEFCGGEVKIRDLKKAQMLHERGYLVLPDPTDPSVIKQFERGGFKEFLDPAR